MAQDCEGVFDSLYFQLIPVNGQGVPGGVVAEGSMFTIEVRSVDFELFTFQYTVAYDTSKLIFHGTNNINSELDGDVASFESEPGRIGVIWTNMNAENQELPDGTLLYNMSFTSLISEEECLPLALINMPVESELASVLGNEICITLEPNDFLFIPPLCSYFDPNDMDFDGFSSSEDCDDTDPNINPDAIDICDGIDNNCNGEIDEFEIFVDYYADNDGDGYGDPSITITSCDNPENFVANSDDCDDTNPAIYPDAQEICDGIDNDCDGEIDEGLIGFFIYLDSDGDGFGDPLTEVYNCQALLGYVLNADDCDDTNPSINPDEAEECDGVDNDCDGEIDENETENNFYLDSDGDGFGDPLTEVSGCEAPEAYVANSDDCDDSNPAINPGAAEECDGIDNDCDGEIDNESIFYADNDGDGYGDPLIQVSDCEAPSGYVSNSDDCDDTNPSINPGAAEECDGIDNDCDGEIDENGSLISYYADFDGDGYGDPATEVSDCEVPLGYVTNFDDCDDTNAFISPEVVEECDGIDNNCDGTIDEGFVVSTYYADLDGDGYGDPNNSTTACMMPQGFVESSDDCDDQNANINPGAVEIRGNGIDEDCDGIDGTVSTKEAQENLIKVYPNPASDLLYLDFDEFNSTNSVFIIYDQTSKLLSSFNMSKSTSEIEIHQLNPGIYLYRIIVDESKIAVGKFVKI